MEHRYVRVDVATLFETRTILPARAGHAREGASRYGSFAFTAPRAILAKVGPEVVPFAAMVVKKLKEGQYVWVKDASIAGTDLYTKGHILGINGNKARFARARSPTSCARDPPSARR